MEDTDPEQEEFLSLSLAITTTDAAAVTASTSEKRSNNKGKNPKDPYELVEEVNIEEKVFSFLQMREQILRQGGSSSVSLFEAEQDGTNDERRHRLIHLLLNTATAVEDNDVGSALEKLNELYKSVSLTGDSVQRLVAYFADGLTVRILINLTSNLSKSLSQILLYAEKILKESPTREEEFLAFTYLYRVSPYYQFAHFTANQAIIEAFDGEQETNNGVGALHVIDFDVSYGFQWPSLIQSLSEKASSSSSSRTGMVSLRITGFGRSIEELQETESRLVSFSSGFHNLVFEFQGFLRGSNINYLNLVNLMRKRKNETLAVNLVFHLSTLSNFLKISDTLRFVHSLNPSIVLLVEQEGIFPSTNTTTTSSRRSSCFSLMESVQYFEAIFDSLDDCLPRESTERLSIEKNFLGKQIKSMVNFYGDRNEMDQDYLDGGVNVMMESHYCNTPKRYESMETWKTRMLCHGFVGTEMSSKSMIQAKLLLKIRSSTHYCPELQFDHDQESGGGRGFRVWERDEGRAISLGWQNTFLLTASAWHFV
ncbi:Transcription factor GRAS [Quillaja saponaria]|uniref:Transcription factor GRAS n=1 Tax=Quillaja saponaria TaxID=32244 RepID=A0AAD7L8Y7_QUISA|nr:Transcription factor GRAS [Quillaja saponaria]